MSTAIKPQSQILQEQIGDALAAADAIEEFAASEGRPMNEGEVAEHKQHMDLVESMQPALDTAMRREKFTQSRKRDIGSRQVGPPQVPANVHSEVAASAASRVPYNMPQRTARALEFVRPQKMMSWLKPDGEKTEIPGAFQRENGQFHAYAVGMQLLASGGNPTGRKFCEENELVYYYDNREIYNAQSGDNDAAGGYTVPDPLSSEIIEFRNATGVARMVCDIWPMSSDTLRIPKLVSGQTVYYPGQNVAITASDTTWTQPQLNAVKRATLTQMSSELDEDNIVQFANKIVSRAAYELAWREDEEFIQGDGSAGFGSVSGLQTAVGSDGTLGPGFVTASGGTWADITSPDLSAVAALLPDKHHNGASWICSRAFFHSVIEPLILAQGGSTGIEMSAGAGRNLFGYPVHFTEAMPTATALSQKCLFFGNYADGVALGTRRQVTVMRSEHAAFESDALMFRLTTRYDILAHSVSWADDVNASVVGLVTAAA